MLTISQVYMLKDLAQLSGQSIHTIKFYLQRGLIHEAGRSPGTRFRYFNEETIERLRTIRVLRKQHKSLAEIEQLLAAHHGAAVESSGPVV